MILNLMSALRLSNIKNKIEHYSIRCVPLINWTYWVLIPVVNGCAAMRISCIFLLVNSSRARDELECIAIVQDNAVAAIFPVIKERSAWEWYRIERTPELAEYAWIAEPEWKRLDAWFADFYQGKKWLQRKIFC